MSYADSGDDDFAINLFTKAIELDPTFSDAYNDRGASYVSLGEYSEAEADFTKAIELVPDDADYYNNRGVVRMSLFEVETSIDDFSTAIELDPGMIDAYLNRSMVYARLQRFEESLTDLGRILELDSEYAEIHSYRADILMALDRPRDALYELDRLIGLRVADRNAHANRAIVLVSLGEEERAQIDFDIAVELGADPDRLKLTLDRVRTERGRLRRAVVKMGADRRRATTRVAPTKGLAGPFSYQSLMSAVTCTTYHENEVCGVVLTWQMAGAWIPAYAGMTVGMALVVRAGFKPAPTSAGWPGPFSYQSLMSVVTDTTNHENGRCRDDSRIALMGGLPRLFSEEYLW